MKTIQLNDLETFCTLSPGKCTAMAEAAAVCLESQQHISGTILQVEGAFSNNFSVLWNKIDLKVRHSWGNLEESVEDAAYGLAILTIWQLTDYQVIKQSFRGSGFDYWLGEKNFSDEPFQEKARLEVSGILNGTKGQINQRLKEKLTQTQQSDHLKIPVYIVIAEFSNPKIKIHFQ